MTPQTCKKLLEMGILQAYAEGKTIQLHKLNVWRDFEEEPAFSYNPEQYRIKPEPQFEVGDLVRTDTNKIATVDEILLNNVVVLDYKDGKLRCTYHTDYITKVREVRTPFTFEEAVKACAKHGKMIIQSIGGKQYEIIGLCLDYVNIRRVGVIAYDILAADHYIFLNNTPFCNISYEPITN